MSLDTVLQIGKILRNSVNSLKYFNHVVIKTNLQEVKS